MNTNLEDILKEFQWSSSNLKNNISSGIEPQIEVSRIKEITRFRLFNQWQ